jgi:hypothetical protein
MFKDESRHAVAEAQSILGLQAVGNYQEFLRGWYLRSSLILRGEILPSDPDDCERVVAIMPGMRRGANAAGLLYRLQKLGFIPDGLQGIVGSSVGATIAREYAGNNIHTLKELFVDDRIRTRSGSRRRAIFLDRPLPPLVDFVVTEDLFRALGAPEEVIAAAHPKIYMGLRDMETGKNEFMSTEDMSDTIIGAISSMTINFVTKRRLTPLNGRMYADPLHRDRELIEFAARKFRKPKILALFASNPMEENHVDRAFNYLVRFAEHGHNVSHLLAALYELRNIDDGPEFYRDLISGKRGIDFAGIYPHRMPMAPNEQNLGLVRSVVQESEDFAEHIYTS